MSKRFSVKTATRTEDVGADEMRVGKGGTLEFRTDGRLDVVYARHAWTTAEFSYEED